VKVKIIIKDSVVVLPNDELRREIDNFDIASATPEDCHYFIRRLKRLWK